MEKKEEDEGRRWRRIRDEGDGVRGGDREGDKERGEGDGVRGGEG